MIIFGIDPGQTGALVAILPDHSLEWIRFKNTENFSNSCIMLRLFIERFAPSKPEIYLEHVHSRPSQGAQSIFTFGRVAGFIEGMLAQEGLYSHTLVEPSTWQQKLGLLNVVGKETFKNADAKKRARKKAYMEHAKKLFPKYRDQITLDLADAILIAEYGYRKELQKEEV